MFKLTGICGMATLLVFPMVLIAIQLSPWFSWSNNALSDLGVSGPAATIFNSSLIVGGTLSFIFSLGVRKVLPSKFGWLGVILFAVASLSLIGIGVFPETAGRIHTYFSTAFFALLGLSLLANGSALLLSSRKLGSFTILLGVVSGVVWLFPHRGVAIPEFISALGGSIWSAVMGAKLLRTSAQRGGEARVSARRKRNPLDHRSMRISKIITPSLVLGTALTTVSLARSELKIMPDLVVRTYGFPLLWLSHLTESIIGPVDVWSIHWLSLVMDFVFWCTVSITIVPVWKESKGERPARSILP